LYYLDTVNFGLLDNFFIPISKFYQLYEKCRIHNFTVISTNIGLALVTNQIFISDTFMSFFQNIKV